MSVEKKYSVQTMSREQVDLAVEWAASEGWNPGLHDAHGFYKADPHGFLMGFVENEPIASISVIKYGETFGFLGFYIVKSEFRGKGYGMDLWKAGLDYLKGRNIGLDGVLEQQENYKKSGFQLAYSNIRYEANGGGQAPDRSEIVELSSIAFETIDAYDRPFFPAKRTTFLQAWIDLPQSHALGFVHKGKLMGYGMVRQCRSGFKIGPLFADSSEIAESLFLALKSKTQQDAPFYLDTPEVNRAAIELAEKHQMSAFFQTARMYTKEIPDLPLDRVFGVTSFELG